MRHAALAVLVAMGCGSVSSDPIGAAGAGGHGGEIATSSGGAAGDGARGGAGSAPATGGTTATGGTAGLQGGAAVGLQLAERDTNATDAAIAPFFQITNNGTAPLALSTLTLRYWYTAEGAPPAVQQASCDFAQVVGCSQLTMAFVPVVPPRTGADCYFEVGFTAGAGELAPGATLNDIEVRFNKSDFTAYDETDDYSYTASTSFRPTTKVTAYVAGVLVSGVEP